MPQLSNPLMKKFSKKQKQIFEIIILSAIALTSYLVWDTIIIYPIKLIVVTLHEISHGIAAIISGGEVISLDIGFNLGGKCTTQSGEQMLIASAGYPGSFIFGALIFSSAYSKRFGNWLLGIIAVIVLLFIANLSQNMNLNLLLFSSVIIIALIKIFAPQIISNYLIKTIGLVSCFYVAIDIFEDVLSQNQIVSDATIIAGLSGISEVVWGFAWLAITITGIVFLFRFGYKKGITY